MRLPTPREAQAKKIGKNIARAQGQQAQNPKTHPKTLVGSQEPKEQASLISQMKMKKDPIKSSVTHPTQMQTVRTYVVHMLRIYDILYCNWLIL